MEINNVVSILMGYKLLVKKMYRVEWAIIAIDWINIILLESLKNQDDSSCHLYTSVYEGYKLSLIPELWLNNLSYLAAFPI